MCRSCDIGFIGPTPEAMEQVGDKNSARALAREANVPTVPGSDGIISGEQEAVKVARDIGFPVLLKATAGGGGKGMCFRGFLNTLSSISMSIWFGEARR